MLCSAQAADSPHFFSAADISVGRPCRTKSLSPVTAMRLQSIDAETSAAMNRWFSFECTEVIDSLSRVRLWLLAYVGPTGLQTQIVVGGGRLRRSVGGCASSWLRGVSFAR
jgi:hypothetical protein